ncbi:MAG: sulfurtransferase [Bradymonadaceae bacterium]
MKNSHWSQLVGRLGRAHLTALSLGFIVAFSSACVEPEVEAPEGCDAATLTCSKTVFLEVEEFEFLRLNGAHVIDVRGSDTFADGHVPGAANTHWNAFAEPDRNGILLESEAALQEVARSLGINNDSTILVYGNGGTGDSAAGRLFWTLEYLGHDKVYLLDGGIEAWKEDAGVAVGTGAFQSIPEGDFTVNLRPELRATIEEVEDAMENGTLKLVDTRNIEEYLGEEEALRGNPRGGYIPTAVHYHWEDVIGDNGRLRPAEDIRAELEALGIVDGTLTIPYCQSGVRSGYFYAVLKWLGYPTAKNYDGSWWEWSRETDLAGEYE